MLASHIPPSHRFAIYMLLVSFTQYTLIGTQALRIPKRATVCNGSSDLCNRSYGNVTFAGAHDSYAIGSSVAANQNVSITAQLDAGIRMLQAQAHNSTNATVTGAGIDLCHTSCTLYQGGAIENWLSQIVSWSNANPNEVVTLLIVNSDGIAPSRFAQAYQSTGMTAKSYSPPSATLQRPQWPTLGTLIDNRQPIITFMTPGADFNSVPYIIDEFSNIWENPFNQVTTPFNCSIDRIGQGVPDATALLYISNQFLDTSILDGGIVIPNIAALGTTNSVAETLSTSNDCAAQHGVYPSFILTDYSTVPSNEVVRAVAQMNNVPYTGPSVSSSGTPTSSTSSPGGSGGTGSSGSGSSSSNGVSPMNNYLNTLTLTCSFLAIIILY